VAPESGWLAGVRQLLSGVPQRLRQQPPPTATDAPDAALAAALRQLAQQGPSRAMATQIAELPDPDGTAATRDRLIRAAIKFRDQLGDGHPQSRALLLSGLQAVGVREVLADGQVLDGARHDVFAVEPAPRPDLHDHVARTVVCGYATDDRVLRVPSVVVYVHEPTT
jgi:molecular chaperone GrpE